MFSSGSRGLPDERWPSGPASHAAGAAAPVRTLTPDDLACIRASRCWCERRITQLRTPSGEVIVKGQRPPRRIGAVRLLRLSARVLGLPLQAVPAEGGAAAQETELRQLQQLRAAGLPVPAVLHVDPSFLVLEYLPGSNLAEQLAQGPDLASWHLVAQLILRAHALGHCFSQAVARNFLLTPEGAHAVDFEEDPLTVMPLREAQARDWLLYLMSTVWLLERAQQPDLLQLWRALMAAEAAEVVALLRKTTHRLGWLRALPKRRRPWGRDVVGLQAAAEFLTAWAE